MTSLKCASLSAAVAGNAGLKPPKAQARSRHSSHRRGRTLATARSLTAMSPASISTNNVEFSISREIERNSEVLPTPGSPTIKILAPLFSARRWSTVMIFMAQALPKVSRDGAARVCAAPLEFR